MGHTRWYVMLDCRGGLSGGCPVVFWSQPVVPQRVLASAALLVRGCPPLAGRLLDRPDPLESVIPVGVHTDLFVLVVVQMAQAHRDPFALVETSAVEASRDVDGLTYSDYTKVALAKRSL